jgi:hypothetical protein
MEVVPMTTALTSTIWISFHTRRHEAKIDGKIYADEKPTVFMGKSN